MFKCFLKFLSISLLIFLLLPLTVFSQPQSATEETITITTYYPAPYGSYAELSTTGNTYLATEGGRVGIGTMTPDAKLEVNGQEFEVRGEISAVSGNTFVVLGQTITVDPSKVSKFKQKGILEVGKRVKAEGVIQNGTKFASEINVIGTGQGRFKFEVRGNNITLNPTAIITPTGVAPSGTITPTPTTESASFDAKVKVKAQGSIDQVIAFLKQVMTLLENLI